MPHEYTEPTANGKAVAGAAEPESEHVLLMISQALLNLREARDTLTHTGWSFWIDVAITDIKQVQTLIKEATND